VASRNSAAILVLDHGMDGIDTLSQQNVKPGPAI